MNVSEILNGKIASCQPFEINNISFFHKRPTVAVGNISFGENGHTEAHWTFPSGECFIGEKKAPQHNLLKA